MRPLAPLDPSTTAVVTSECQLGVLGDADGDGAIFPQLAAAARPAMLEALVRVVVSARTHGAPVIHGLAERRADGQGSNTNARLFAAAARSDVVLLAGSPQAGLVEELAGHASDLRSTRTHGLNPMAGTDLDPLLRNLGITTLVVVGVSVNVAITNLVMDAVNLGYRVILPRDAVVGIPTAYADQVIDQTLALLATVTTSDQVVAALSASTI